MGTELTSLKKIKPKYIGIWLKDQLSRPDWFRNLIVNRSAWGAFSIYAHAKRSDGRSKITYKSRAKADKAAFDMTKRYGYPFTTYKCLFCDDKNGVEPIPMNIFLERKEIIKELSKI